MVVNSSFCFSVVCLVTQLCPTLCNSIDCSLSGFSVHGDSPGKNAEVDCHFLLQGIFPTQRLNPGLPHCRRILYCLSHQESLAGQVYFHAFFKNIKSFHGLSPVNYIKIFDIKCKVFKKYQLLP